MKKVLALIMCVFLFATTSISVQAKSLEDTITALVEQISKDLDLETTPKLCFYSAKEWYVAATYYPGLNYIYVNLSTFEDSEDADAAGETVQYHMVKIIAHEVRHDYQYEHQEDDSDYGRACKQGFIDHQSYDGDIEAYNKQFIEADAEEYAKSYADRYCK